MYQYLFTPGLQLSTTHKSCHGPSICELYIITNEIRKNSPKPHTLSILFIPSLYLKLSPFSINRRKRGNLLRVVCVEDTDSPEVVVSRRLTVVDTT